MEAAFFPTIKIYNWNWLLKDKVGEIFCEDKVPYFTLEDCQYQASKNPEHQKYDLEINSAWGYTPSNELIMQRCFIMGCLYKIERLAKFNCYGCENDRPSQIDHMQGCLDEFENTIEAYAERVKIEEINQMLVDEVFEFFEIPLSSYYGVSADVHMPLDKFKKLLMEAHQDTNMWKGIDMVIDQVHGERSCYYFD